MSDAKVEHRFVFSHIRDAVRAWVYWRNGQRGGMALARLGTTGRRPNDEDCVRVGRVMRELFAPAELRQLVGYATGEWRRTPRIKVLEQRARRNLRQLGLVSQDREISRFFTDAWVDDRGEKHRTTAELVVPHVDS